MLNITGAALSEQKGSDVTGINLFRETLNLNTNHLFYVDGGRPAPGSPVNRRSSMADRPEQQLLVYSSRTSGVHPPAVGGDWTWPPASVASGLRRPQRSRNTAHRRPKGA